MAFHPLLRSGMLLGLLFTLASCSTERKDSAPIHPIDVSHIPDAVPQQLPKSRYGNPAFYTVYGKRYDVLESAEGYDKRGIASWYGTKFHGRLTSTRETYDMYAMTAASPVLPLPTFVRVTNLENSRSVIVKVNDRGPFASDRILDLSYAAAKKLGYANKGTALVEVQAINPGQPLYSTLQAKKPRSATPNEPKLYVQVGAFHDLNHARKLRAQLQVYLNQPIIIHETESRLTTLYRVQVGPLSSASESDQLQATLKNHGFNETIAVII